MKIIIFAGGTGKRLWPVSRINSPKQFQKIYGHETSLENSFNTIKSKFNLSDIFVSTGNDYVEDVLRTLPNLPPSNLILEPFAKDTAAAVAYAMIKVSEKYPNEPVVIRWQNSLIKNPEKFISALDDAEKLFESRKANFVYLAVPSKYPNTNVGYIQAKFESKSEFADNDISQFIRFTEKPDETTANSYQSDGTYFWNPGCYITTPKFVLDSFEKYNQEFFKNFIKPIYSSLGLKSEWDQTRKVFEAVDKESIDCALWEKLPSDGIKVVACDYDWNYVSTWADIKSALTDSEDQNYIQGKVITDQIQNSLIVNFTNRLVVVTELDDVAVINTEDAILVTKKSHAGKVKDLVKKLEDSGLQKYL